MPMQCFNRVESQFPEKNPVLPIDKFSSLVLTRNTIKLQHLIIQFRLYYLSSGRLWEVENKRNLQPFSSKSGRGRLQEVVAYTEKVPNREI